MSGSDAEVGAGTCWRVQKAVTAARKAVAAGVTPHEVVLEHLLPVFAVPAGEEADRGRWPLSRRVTSVNGYGVSTLNDPKTDRVKTQPSGGSRRPSRNPSTNKLRSWPTSSWSCSMTYTGTSTAPSGRGSAPLNELCHLPERNRKK